MAETNAVAHAKHVFLVHFQSALQQQQPWPDIVSIDDVPYLRMPGADDSKRKAARETLDILNEISTLLESGF